MAFIPLFCQSHYSPRGVASCADLVRRARGLGYTVLGLCDDATMAGFHEFDEACRDQSLRPVFGCRLHVAGLVLEDLIFPVDFLIETEQGYRNLVRLLTEQRREESGVPRRRSVNLKERTAGLRVVIPPDGEWATLLGMRDRVLTEKFLHVAIEYFPSGFAFALSGGEDPGTSAMIRRLARFVRVPAVAAPPMRLSDLADAPVYEYLSQPHGPEARGWQMPDRLSELPLLRPEKEVLDAFPEEDEAVHAGGPIARQCKWRPSVNRRIIPTQDFERGFDPNSFLFDLVIRGAGERYGEITEAIKQRLNAEFEELKARDLATWLLLHRQITDFLDGKGIARGVGRGSLVASMTAYCLGLTKIDPDQYRLAAQPLVGEGEVFPPLRIEIPSSAAAVLLDHLRTTYGDDHLARIGRRAPTRRDQAIEELARWAGMTDEERRLAMREKSRIRAGTMAERLRARVDRKRSRRWRDPALIAEMAARLSGRPRELQPTPNKWTLSAEPLEYVIPTLPSGDGELIAEIEEKAVDRLGAPRLEFAPHHLLNLLDRSRQAAAETHADLDLSRIPLDDRATWDLIGAGDTAGIPRLDNITLKALLRKERPTNVLQLLTVKLKAGGSVGENGRRDLTEELPDVLLSYQCAYLKANYPDAFYAGALSSAGENEQVVAVLAAQARRDNIRILPPDINLSGAHCTLQGGKVRLGLRMIHRFGEKAWDEIASIRRGGRFNSLAEFCEGVSARTINSRLLHNLIAAGAFDGFGQSRARMSDMANRLQRKARAQGVNEETEAQPQFMLFDLNEVEEEVEEAPEEGLGEEWDRAKLIRREREALGFNLSVETMDCYPRAAEALKPLRPAAVTPRMARRFVRVAGIVDHVERGGALLESDDAALVDLEGLPVYLAPAIAKAAERAFGRGEEVLAIGDVNADRGYLRIDAQGLWRLQELEEQARRVARIRLNLEGENRTTLRHLVDLARGFRGETRIEETGYAAARGFAYRALKRQRVFFCSPFFQGLCKILPPENIELFDADDRPLALALSGKTAKDAADPNETLPKGGN